MGNPAANKNSMVQAVDIHIVMVPTAAGPAPIPLPHVFMGQMGSALSTTVNIAGQPAAMVDSVADNKPQHIAMPPGTSFQKPPANQGTVTLGSFTVKMDGKYAARLGDSVKTCNDPADMLVGTVITGAVTVMIG